MVHRVISFYREFSCLGADCPQTCCRGWKILVDDATYARICADPSETAIRINKKVAGRKEHYIRQGAGGCPFQTREGLCGIQTAGREDLMSAICLEYPRRILDFGVMTETTLELACPYVAELFLQQEEFSMTAGGPAPHHKMWKVENDDAAFLALLEEVREAVIGQIKGCSCFDAAAMNECYGFFRRLHESVVRDRMDEAKDMVAALKIVGENGEKMLFYPMELTDKVIAYQIDSPRMGRKHPQLKQLLRRYYHYFNQLTQQEAEAFFNGALAEMEQELPQTKEKYRRYFIYYLYEMLLAAYEDYHLLKVALLGLMYLQIYMLIDVVAYLDCKKEKKPYTPKEQAFVLSNVERRMRHNTALTRGILERLRKDFL